MTKSLLKNTFREIKNSKARFISIMAIIALGVGFFAGIKATVPSMYNLAESYYNEQNLMDYRLVSTVGFDEDDIKAVEKTEGVSFVMPSYFSDAQLSAESGGNVVRLIAVPEKYNGNAELNSLVLKEGRMPEKPNEILVEHDSMSGTRYKIGDKITLLKKAGDSDLTEQLNCLEYTVVGLVNSPLYISYERGTTNIGNGKISEYMYIGQDCFKAERYTELYVKADFSEKYSAFSNDYEKNSETFAKTLEKTAKAQCEVFNKDVIEKSKDELEDTKNEYSDKKSKAEKQLDDAKDKINESKKKFDEKISAAQNELDSAKTQIESGRNELESSKNEYYSKIAYAENEISKQETQLKNAENEYNKSKSDFDSQITSAQNEINNGKAEYETAYNEFKNTQEPQLLAGIEQAQLAVDSLKTAIAVETNPDVQSILNAQLEQAQQTLDNLSLQYSQALSQFEETESTLNSAQAELDLKKSEGQQQLDLALAQIENGKAALKNGKSELETQKRDGYNKLAEAENSLNSAQSQYDNGLKELETQKTDGQQKLDDAQKEYDKEKSKADKKFAEAEEEINNAQEKLDKISSPEWYVFTRDDNPGYSSFSQNADRLDAVASVFPMFFLLVAVLVCVTTMTRLIEEKRTEIATFKALGYSNISIVAKFVIYALIAAIIGSVIGTIIGVCTLPFIIFNAYKIMYYIGDISLVLNVASIVLGIAAAVLCTTVISVVVCMRSLSHKPAEAMRPKAPKPGKRILLEYITPLWNRFSFTAKLTARNLFRYKSRLCMTVIGVAGCTALIVAAFGLLNSFDPLTKDQFETIYKYDAVIVPKESGTQEELDYLVSEVENKENVSNFMLTSQEDATVEFNGKIKNESTYLTVVQSPDELGSIISLHTRTGNEELALTDNGVLINEKLSEEFGIKTGDTIKVSGEFGENEATVCGIFEQYLQNYIYMTPTLYNTLYGKNPSYNILDVKLKDNSQTAQESFSSEILKDDRVAAVSFIASSLEEFKNMLNSLNLVVLVMIICAAALAFVVLYNLTNINIAERVREIATFKVLGFNNKETSSFIYKENIVLTLLGIIFGLVLGIFLTSFIVHTVEIDNIMFGRVIYPTTYIFAAGFTMLFSLIVNAVMSFKIKDVNMVESLKSVE